jgi:hypothetical protein
MTNVLTNEIFRNATANHVGDGGHAKRMETCGGIQFEAMEKAVPLGLSPCAFGVGRRFPSVNSFFGLEPLEQGNQIGVQKGDESLASFGSERDGLVGEADIGQVEPRFVEPTTLIASDFERDEKEIAIVRVGDLLNCLANQFDFVFGKRRLNLRIGALDAQSDTWVALAVATDHGFGHDDAEAFKIEQRGVPASAVFPDFEIGMAAPVHILETMFADELGGLLNATLIQEQFQRTPTIVITFQGDRAGSVTNGKEVGNPRPGFAALVARVRKLGEILLGFELTGAAYVRGNADSALRGDAPNDTVFISEFKPEDLLARVEARHNECNLVCLGLQLQAKILEYPRRQSNNAKAKSEPEVRILSLPPLQLQWFTSVGVPRCAFSRFNSFPAGPSHRGATFPVFIGSNRLAGSVAAPRRVAGCPDGKAFKGGWPVSKCCERDHNGDGNCDRHPAQAKDAKPDRRLRSGSDWEKLSGIVVLSEDGWDHGNGQDGPCLFRKKISQEEFIRRCASSMCRYPPDFFKQPGLPEVAPQ